MGKGRIQGFICCEVQIQVNESRHEVGLARPHGQAEQVIRIGDAVESIDKKLRIVNAGWFFFNLRLQLSGDLLAAVIGLGSIFIKGGCSGILSEESFHSIREGKLGDIQCVECSCSKQL